MSVRIVPFSEAMLPQAGELLSRRHARDRVSLPVLPARFAEQITATGAVQTSLRRENARGFAALDHGSLVAYLIGDLLIDDLWGRSGWVRPAGCAYDPDAGVEVVRDLYAALGECWVGYGVFAHFALIPVSDPALLHAWFSLSFGIEQVHALADLAVIKPAPLQVPDGLEIGLAGQEDREAITAMSDVIWRAQVQAPTWAPIPPEAIRETTKGWAELLDEPDVTLWLAKLRGRVVGIQGYWPSDAALGASGDNLNIPEGCVHMSVAGTHEAERGKGISTLLTSQGLAHAQSVGYRVCDTDWRSANLLASRFWPRQGFRPVMYRLVRRVDSRIAWANGSAPV